MTTDIADKSIVSQAKQMETNTHEAPLCKHCRKASLNRIHRGSFVRTYLFFLPLKRYICYRCHRKTYRWSKRQEA
ncbi:hypothetical protein [Mucilaginibacter aquaedulcis]|jgi:ribosomal protein L37AE/L43A|uniref:hypothetical protein n=1 Tax=Mucilaginibacter aquaedulcis TaxID=1187081 RepID=UPI0025B5556D|nr:hypothetical protein [Mucilaginibacter aquaedulcis]MDN3547128.1 hypothetical protein [Mucilaginibacter aquaedulcis]